jgi:hypothetical protein
MVIISILVSSGAVAIPTASSFGVGGRVPWVAVPTATLPTASLLTQLSRVFMTTPLPTEPISRICVHRHCEVPEI